MEQGTYQISFKGSVVGTFRVDQDNDVEIVHEKGSKKLSIDIIKKMANSPYYRIKKVPGVATIAVIVGNKMLMGVRKDNGRVTNPGGHIDEGEEPVIGAVRELEEETGIVVSPEELISLGSEIVDTDEGKKEIFCYALTGQKPDITFKFDPDHEFSEAYWVDCSNGVSDEVIERLHTPIEKNVLLKKLFYA